MGKRGPKPRRKEVAWSSEFAYAVGLIATDGCLSNDGRHLFLVSKDTEQLNNLKKCLDLKVKIGIHTSGRVNDKRRYHRVQWGDVVLYNFLLTVGLMPNKSRQLGALEIPDNLFFDFLRGSFDGDGCFYSYFDPRWGKSFMFYLNFTSASAAHIDWLRKTLQRLLGVKGHISLVKGDGQKRHQVSNLRYAKKETLKVLQAIYKYPDAPHLSRKRLKIEHALRIVGLSLPKSKGNLAR